MKAQLNRILQSHGLATMAEPAALMAQLGFLVRDHEHFRSLLMACDPMERRNMYYALTPNLQFAAKPLDVYVSEAGADAEARQLPIRGEDGKLRAYNAPVIESDDFIAQAAVTEALAKQHLYLVCRKCTKERVFDGMRKADCVDAARSAGWTYGLDAEGKGRELCPDCDNPPLSREEFRMVAEFKMQGPAIITRYMVPLPTWTRADWDREALKAARAWDADGRPTLGPVRVQ